MASDLLLNSDDEMIIKNGDFLIGVSDEQHIDHIVRFNKGDVLDSPLTGVGIEGYINGALSSKGKDEFKREIRLQLEADGAKRVRIEFLEELNIEGSYE